MNRAERTEAFLEGVFSVFDLGESLPKKDVSPKSAEHDMEKLLNDQKKLVEDYQKATNRILMSELIAADTPTPPSV